MKLSCSVKEGMKYEACASVCRCVCARGYAGRFCEIAPVPGAIEYYVGGVCENHDCKNGGLCIQPPGSPEYICKCPPGTHSSNDTIHTTCCSQSKAYVIQLNLPHATNS